ncbi:hypothetical protein FVE67_06420 [Thermosulfurimonas marina]|uniref:Uncharacterized protein n=1 Tax=Thermosulfurimonas marina TaxID=2047767 RepID=A0A6H1WTI1_9BACT|nr:hypothetical protein [Thermosulfurimonas marina]QJA06459.1 hypothetical protein FVE67_06420 [Thermosulfurimonas marina]
MRYLKEPRPDPTRLIEEKLSVAEELYHLWGESFRADPEVPSLLEAYRQAVEASNRAMEEAGTFRECYVCSVEDGQGCCKIGLENECTVLILLLNRLLGVELPQKREVPGRCFFVGPRGCKILARPMLCRDYFCRRHHQKVPEAAMIRVTQVLNEELTLLYRITSLLRARLEFWTGDFLQELDLTGYT